MEADNTGQMSAPGFTVSAQPTSQTFVTLVTTTSSSTTQFIISTAFQTVTVSATASPDSQDSNTDRKYLVHLSYFIFHDLVLIMHKQCRCVDSWCRTGSGYSSPDPPRRSLLYLATAPASCFQSIYPHHRIDSKRREITEVTFATTSPIRAARRYHSPAASRIVWLATRSSIDCRKASKPSSGSRTARGRACARISGKRYTERNIPHGFAIS